MGKKRSSKNFCLYTQNGSDDIQKWVDLRHFWKILALGSWLPTNYYMMILHYVLYMCILYI